MIKNKILNRNYLDSYGIFILKDFNEYFDIISLFCIYYDNFENADRFEFIDTRLGKKEWSFCKTNKFYNKNWLEDNADRF